MKKCVKCGFELDDEALFCASCGTKQPGPDKEKNTSVPTEDLRDQGKAAPEHDPHRNPYVEHGHGPDREPNTRRNAETEERRVQDPASARAAAKKEQRYPSGEAKQKKGKKRHPVLSVFLVILFFLCFNLGLLSLFIHYTFSTERLEEVILETDISELEIGGFARLMRTAFEDQLDDSEYDKLADALDDMFDGVEDDSTLGELVRKSGVSGPFEVGTYGQKAGYKALDSLAFKEELSRLITNYTGDIFFGSGQGKVDTDDLTDLMYAFYSAYYKEAMKKARDNGDISDVMYERALEQYGGENLRREIRKGLENDLGYDDDSLKELSVKKLFKDQPLWIARVLASLIFGAGMVVLGFIFLILSYLVNRKGVKRALIKTGIVLAVEMFLIGLFLIGLKISESLLTSGSARAMGDLMLDLMRE